MKERRKTHLVYLDSNGRVWMQEHRIGENHPQNAEFWCEVPSNEDSRWIEGRPRVSNAHFLTLSPFYPSQRLDVEVEINREPKVMRHENHPAFAGCVKYMPVDLLDFRPMPRYIGRSIYTIGLCYSSKQTPYKTVDIEGDDKSRALSKGREILNPSVIEHVICVGVRPNEEYDKHHGKKPPKLKF